jgi:hypothetical protein
MALDAAKVAEIKVRLAAEIDACVADLNALCPDILARYKTNTKHGKAGEYKKNVRTGVPHLKADVLRTHLREVAEKQGLGSDNLPVTPTGKLGTALDTWREIAPEAPLVKAWCGMADAAKLHQFLCQLQGQTSVHPEYRALVRTGRTSCSKPNMQQMPREPWFRSLFVARPGHKLVIVDYAAIELRTLAAVCLDRYGKSVLADTIKAGRDPHAYTAAMVQGLSYEDFLARKRGDPAGFKRARQAAKAINFGVPGGLGAPKLAAYAKANYGVEMSLAEASTLRDKLVTVVYPELQTYLSDDFVGRLAKGLVCPRSELEAVMGLPAGEEGRGLWRSVEKIICGSTKKVDGSPYNPTWQARVWEALQACNQRPELAAALAEWKGSRWLHGQLCGDAAVTLTGRVRGGVSYCEARNTPFQGLAADGAKVALWRLWKAGYKIVAFVHDEIVCEVPAETAERDKEAIERIMIEAMSSVLQCDIPVEVEGHVAEAWTK